MPEDLSPAIRRLLLTREVEEFFYQEAELLDQRHYEEWLELFTDDTRYFMPMRRNVKFDQTARENTTGIGDMSWFDEGKETLSQRVRQILTGIHWAEEPPVPASATSYPTCNSSAKRAKRSPPRAASSSTATASRPRPTFS